MTLVKTLKEERFSQAELDLFLVKSTHEVVKSNSTAWGRVNPNGLFRTIATTLQVKDSRAGTTIHWAEDRVLTTMEAKRAQGYPDEEVLVGIRFPSDGWHILNNSVARTVSTALGLSLREAWLKNPVEPGSQPQQSELVQRKPHASSSFRIPVKMPISSPSSLQVTGTLICGKTSVSEAKRDTRPPHIKAAKRSS